MTDLTLYHNPRCSKSRGALELLEARGLAPTVVRYLETPPSAEELRSLLGKLGIAPRELLRSGEDEYKALGLADSSLSDEQLIAAIRAQAQGEISECGRRIELSRTAIAREKRVAAESGYEDARLLHWLGQQIIACQEVQAAARKRLEEIKTNPDAAIERAKPAPPVIANGGRVRPPQ